MKTRRESGKLLVAPTSHRGTKAALPIADETANKGDEVTPRRLAGIFRRVRREGDSDITVGTDVAEPLGRATMAGSLSAAAATSTCPTWLFVAADERLK